jgi:hypothetical protein
MGDIYFHDLLGRYFFLPILMMEFYVYLVHWGAILRKLPQGRPYKESFIRMSLVFETYSLHSCFWLLNYSSWQTMMTIHYIFHLASNFWNAFILLPDFSKPAPNIALEWFGNIVLVFDIPCHTYLIYYLCSNVMTGVEVIITLILFTFAIYFYPWQSVFEPIKAD